ncbi:nad kinase [hydrocarbon metagenome]|uniref:Nad kinase n=1 Tax=hydrocarbon metagenome TaxID=938273 RepID=A0A0W8E595_9ZZZZ
MKVLILYKSDSRAYQLTQRIREDLTGKGAIVSTLDSNKISDHLSDLISNDLILVLGGDGTILKTAQHIAGTGIPLLGVNLGKVGFLSSIEPDEWPVALDRLVNFQYSLDKYLMIKTELISEGQRVELGTALNDVVIRSQAVRPITIGISIDNQNYSIYRGDGVICATPTGSTAYSYSAGGPVLADNVKALVITPICPLLSCGRALVVDAESQITITSYCEFATEVTLDGENKGCLNKRERVLISRSDKNVSIIRMDRVGLAKKIHHTWPKTI